MPEVGTTSTPRINSLEDVHNFRTEIDANIKKAQAFAQGYFVGAGSTKGKRECALVITKLQEAKMWCGKILEAENKPFPEEFRDHCKERSDLSDDDESKPEPDSNVANTEPTPAPML